MSVTKTPARPCFGADWQTFKDLIDRFGVDKGRLISRLPTRWEKKVIQAAKEAGVSDVRMSSIIERLRDSKHKVVDFNRSYDYELDWINNALSEHVARPFKAIICNAGKATCAEAMHPEDCSDGHALFSAVRSCNVRRTADQIADALNTFAAVSTEVDIVDPYFDLRPTEDNYLAPLVSLLDRLRGGPWPPKVIRVHFRDHGSRPPPELVARNGAVQIKGRLPAGYCLELYAWSQIRGGEDFHDRFVLTDLGGIMIGAGLSADGPTESAAFTFLEFEHAQNLRNRFADGSTVYAHAGSAVRIRDDGSTELFCR